MYRISIVEGGTYPMTHDQRVWMDDEGAVGLKWKVQCGKYSAECTVRKVAESESDEVWEKVNPTKMLGQKVCRKSHFTHNRV